MITFIKYFFLFLLLTLLQIFVFDNISQLIIIRPMIFFFIVMILPKMPTAFYMLLAFFIGLSYDFFSGNQTPGLHAAGCVLIAYMRDRLLIFFEGEEEAENASVHITSLGFRKFFFIVVINAFLFHVLTGFLEVFSFKDIVDTAMRISAGTVVSVALIYLFDILLFYRKAALQ
ncbi:MAG: hypothetical protein EOP53_24635 [Sphingobacteriales bacterium]|nr:MAG: hypothetical protein EOP53_24635 [Sphingobacteriales bacterium]